MTLAALRKRPRTRVAVTLAGDVTVHVREMTLADAQDMLALPEADRAGAIISLLVDAGGRPLGDAEELRSLLTARDIEAIVAALADVAAGKAS